MGVIALTPAPCPVWPSSAMSNSIFIRPNHLVNYDNVHVSVVISSLSVMYICTMLIRASFYLSNSSVNTAFAPWNLVCVEVCKGLLHIFFCKLVKCVYNFAHVLSTLGCLSYFSQSFVIIPIEYMTVYTSVMIYPLYIGCPGSEANYWTLKARSTRFAKG